MISHNENTPTPVEIHVAELRDREREHRHDLRTHDGHIRTLQDQVSRMDERVQLICRLVYALGAGTGALVLDRVAAHLVP